MFRSNDEVGPRLAEEPASRSSAAFDPTSISLSSFAQDRAFFLVEFARNLAR